MVSLYSVFAQSVSSAIGTARSTAHHIIAVCTTDQIKDEMNDLFDFLDRVYSLFGFTYKLELSTRPEGFLGKLEDWEKAEAVRDLHHHVHRIHV